MSRRSCILRDKIVQMILLPQGGKKTQPKDRWKFSSLNVDQAASQLAAGRKKPGNGINKALNRAKEQAKHQLDVWRQVGVR